MHIDQRICVQCESCLPYCPMGAIRAEDGRVAVDLVECVECGVCLRSGVCPTESFRRQPLQWPRSLRGVFSDPLASHATTGVPGRGTEEMKTNDVTGRFHPGEVGVAVELGRPGTGVRFRDVDAVAQACAKVGARFEPLNPVTPLMTDTTTGSIRNDVLDEKVLSAIVEFSVPFDHVADVVAALRGVSGSLSTVFSLDMCCTATPHAARLLTLLASLGCEVRPCGKTNVGLGRPLRVVDAV